MINKKTTCRAALSHTSGHKELSSGCTCKFDIRHAVATDHAQEMSNKHGALLPFRERRNSKSD